MQLLGETCRVTVISAPTPDELDSKINQWLQDWMKGMLIFDIKFVSHQPLSNGEQFTVLVVHNIK